MALRVASRALVQKWNWGVFQKVHTMNEGSPHVVTNGVRERYSSLLGIIGRGNDHVCMG